MKNLDTVRWGIIGCGDVTEKKSGPGLQKADGSQLVAVMRRNSELAKDYARRHGVPKWYDDADQLLNDDEVNAVYIATRPDSHKEYALRAADAGKPIYLEKPMGFDYPSGKEIVEYCRNKNVPLYVAYYRRGMEKYNYAKRLLESGEIGDLRFVRVTLETTPAVEPGQKEAGNLPWRLRKDSAGGGLIMDVGSHGLDLLDYYVGPIAEVSGTASNQAGLYDVEDTVTGHWRFENGVHGVGAWCFTSFRNQDRIDIYGSKGRLSISVLDIASPIVVTTADGKKEHTFEVPDHVQQGLIQTVVNELRGTGGCPSTGDSALRTDRVLHELRTQS